MKRLKIYHNQKCSKSRATMMLLEEAGAKVEVVNYLETPPTAQELDSVLKQLGMNPEQIVRTGEDEYTELKLDQNPPKTREEWLKILIAHPILIERPIVTDGKTAVIGRPPENVLKLLT